MRERHSLSHHLSSALGALILFSLLLVSSWTMAQNYPVQVTTTVIPPYSPELSHYSSAEGNNLQVFIHVLELDRVDLRTKLRITIEGAGVRLTTSPAYVPPALILQGGVPQILTGFDLRNYLNPDNLVFEGITKAAFMRGGQLPEGFYTFTIDVLDYNRGVRISNQGMSTAWIVLNDPPLINFPFNGDKLRTNEPQTLNFSWLGRHLASPNAAFSTEYEFVLYEMYPGLSAGAEQSNPAAAGGPDAAVRSSNSIYRTTTTQSSLFYGPAEPQLTPGKKYAFRIRAYDVGGRDLFKNQGYSETFWFQYGDACLPLRSTSAEVLDANRIRVEWEAESTHTQFKVSYRQKGKTNWLSTKTYSGSQIIPDLQPDTEYEYKVAGMCQQYEGTESSIQTVRTELESEQGADEDFSCGTNSQLPELSPVPLGRDLRPFDQFYIGGIEVIILNVTKNADDTYTGKGYAPAPMFKGAGIKVNIKNVLVNEDHYAIAGTVVTSYDKTGRFIGEIKGKEDEEGGGFSEEEGALPTVVVTVPAEIATVVVIDGVIVITDEAGQVVVAEGASALPEKGKTLTVTDQSGDTWVVDSEGNVSKGAPAGAAASSPDALPAGEQVDLIVAFAASDNQSFGFDDPLVDNKTTTSLAKEYKKTDIQGKDYWVAWKSLATGQTDWVNAIASDGKKFPDYVGFKTTTGEIPTQPGDKDNSKRLSITGQQAGKSTELLAYYKQEVDTAGNVTEHTIGQLNVMTYDKVSQKVIIVPVNTASAPSAATLTTALNRIYGQAVAQWTVEVASKYTVDATVLQTLNDGESGVLASFPSNMQRFNRDFKRSLDNYDKDAYYLFLIPGSDSDRAGLSADRAGFMPFKRQFGYIWTDKTSNQSTTIAHELGHGAFRLRHTFSTDNFVAAQGSTDNLMDYSSAGAGNGGTQLFKHQWDFVHDPESMNGWAQDDAESEMGVIAFNSGSSWKQLFPKSDDATLTKFQQLYDEVATNFGVHYNSCQTNNVTFTGELGPWSIRKSSHYPGRIPQLAGQFESSDDINYSSVDPNEIYLKHYNFKDQTYPNFVEAWDFQDIESVDIALYSYVNNISLDKPTIVDLSELSAITSIKVGSFKIDDANITSPSLQELLYPMDDYVLIAFYSETNSDPDIVFQLIPTDMETKDYLTAAWLKRLDIYQGDPEESNMVTITTDQLSTVFSDTDEEILEEVVTVLNNNAADFGINTVQRMSHFLGQLGHESNGFSQKKEGYNYSPRRIVKTFAYTKYGHLFEEAELDAANCEYIYTPINFDVNSCTSDEETSRGSSTFSYTNGQIRNAYASRRNTSITIMHEGVEKICENSLENRTGITKDNIEAQVSENYNDGKLRVKEAYIRNVALFDVTYACRLGNGNIASGDGSLYRGRGFIQITGKDKYQAIIDEWNERYPDDPKDFVNADRNELETNIEVAMKASMIEWDLRGLNAYADVGLDSESIKRVGSIVNGSKDNPPNGADDRLNKTIAINQAIK
ncbi:fibronectin type III domain-containing protein [Reichenbachiella agarivorans]|uniref:Fibronectin type III domain-containing protein n=1 Tax=Reichenbachiella agarivorans TaxID=2979464 RepID=A0ABY6CT24_9BACT|nr:fibronectin type III domain-containing protein [Reichenbachiella agarivorans]UXP33665.1 fibronectin type III domain-containing protein [Reichenbachiella agarivorans]